MAEDRVVTIWLRRHHFGFTWRLVQADNSVVASGHVYSSTEHPDFPTMDEAEDAARAFAATIDWIVR